MKTISAILLCCSSTLCARAHADSVVLVADRDNTIHSEYQSNSNGLGDYFFAGNTGAPYKRRALIHFDVAAAVPAGATITSVALSLNMSKSRPGTFPVSLHRLLADWGEGISDAQFEEGAGAPAEPGDVTWLERYFGQLLPWTTPGGDFVPTFSATLPIGAVGPYTWTSTPALVADVQGWLGDPRHNFGWMLIGDETTTFTTSRFDSRTNPNGTARPKLVVEFTLCPAPASYCVGAPNTAGAGASMSNGGSTSVAENDFVLRVSGCPPNSVGRFVVGTAQTSVPLGNGFKCIDGTLIRFPIQPIDALGQAQLAVDFGSAIGQTMTVGSARYFQFWYRNAMAGGAGYNLSDGRGITVCP